MRAPYCGLTSGGDTQCPSVISYPVDVPCPGPLLSCSIMSVTFVFSYPVVCFSVPIYDVYILLSIFVCVAASLFFAWVLGAHVSAPYVIAGSMHEL